MCGIALLLWIHDEPDVQLTMDGADALRLRGLGVATDLEIRT